MLGLGNPGAEYAHSRHNVGANIIELLAERHNDRLKASTKERSLMAEVHIETARIVLTFPQTFYNKTGNTTRLLLDRHSIDDLHHLMVVHDEINLPPNKLKMKIGNGLTNNNKLKSIKTHPKTKNFVRVQIDIDKPPNRQKNTNHILRRPSKAEKTELDVAIQKTADAVEAIPSKNTETTQTQFNQRN